MKEFKINTQSITERDNIAISHYLREINHIDRISPDEEVRLTSLIKQGGREGDRAKETLIKANLRFVVSVANQYKRYGMELSDLISEGNIGLIKAAKLFDETRGFKFISYAVWWIRQSIINALACNGNVVRIPLNQQNILNRFHRMQHEVMQKEHRNLTIQEFAEANGYDESSIYGIIQASNRATSVDTPVGEDNDTTILDTMTSGSRADSEVDKESMHADILRMISMCLDAKEATVVTRYYGIGCPQTSMEDIAISIGKSRERTRQICMRAITKLRESPYLQNLAVYLAA